MDKKNETEDKIPMIKVGSESKKTDSKKKKKTGNRQGPVGMIVGYVLCGIMFVMAIATLIFLIRFGAVPNKYLMIFSIVMIVLTVLFVILQRWFVPGIAAKVLSVFLSLVMAAGCYYIGYTRARLKDMAGIATEVSSIHVYVMADDPAQSIADAADYTFGILSTLDRENTDTVVTDINSELSAQIATVEYDSVYDMVAALYSGQVGCVILNSAYISFVTEDAIYASFETDVRSIWDMDIEQEVEINKDQEDNSLSNGDDIFTVYISGVDTRSAANVNSNSDVNILVTVNKNTRQILLLSTPRDYYVPLSISNGVKDKLTHAGGYGIDVSVDTLEMLYDVNIDDYVRINFTGFKKIIDVLGGVSVYSEYSFSEEGYSFSQGYNDLDGEAALVFARTRHAFSDGDRQRGKNQMAVIKAVINKMTTSDALMNYTDTLDALSDSMITSMSYDEISDLVKFQLDDMSPWEVLTYSVNGSDSSNTTYSGGSQMLYVMVPDESTVEQAKQYLTDMYDNKTITITEE